MSRSETMKNALAQAYADTVFEASMHSADPSDTGDNEIGTILRWAVTYSESPTGGVIISDPLSFSVPGGTIATHVGLWDSSGTFLDSYPLDVTTYPTGVTITPTLRYTQN